MATQGFRKVKASKQWLPRVVPTERRTHITFLPTISTIKPKMGANGADSMYTMLEYTPSPKTCFNKTANQRG